MQDALGAPRSPHPSPGVVGLPGEGTSKLGQWKNCVGRRGPCLWKTKQFRESAFQRRAGRWGWLAEGQGFEHGAKDLLCPEGNGEPQQVCEQGRDTTGSKV